MKDKKCWQLCSWIVLSSGTLHRADWCLYISINVTSFPTRPKQYSWNHVHGLQLLLWSVPSAKRCEQEFQAGSTPALHIYMEDTLFMSQLVADYSKMYSLVFLSHSTQMPWIHPKLFRVSSFHIPSISLFTNHHTIWRNTVWTTNSITKHKKN